MEIREIGGFFRAFGTFGTFGAFGANTPAPGLLWSLTMRIVRFEFRTGLGPAPSAEFRIPRSSEFQSIEVGRASSRAGSPQIRVRGLRGLSPYRSNGRVQPSQAWYDRVKAIQISETCSAFNVPKLVKPSQAWKLRAEKLLATQSQLTYFSTA